MKRLHVHSQDQTYSLGYIARMWAHYSTIIEGPPIVHRIVHKVSKVFRKHSQPHSPYVANAAIVVLVNGTRTQCTTLVIATLLDGNTQISEIYGSSMECAIAAGVETGDNIVGKLQRIF